MFKEIEKIRLIRILISFIMILLLTKCDSDNKKGVKNISTIDNTSNNRNLKNNSTPSEVKYIALLENFLDELSSINEWDNTRAVFYKYYYKPDSLIEGELAEQFLWDFERLWLSVKDTTPPYLKSVYYPLYDEELKNSVYGLTVLRNKTCDYCVVLQPKYNKKAVEYFCFKKGKIYSTIGTYDIDKVEYIWYRSKKHPPMRFRER